jgi:acetyl esterase/lipase
MADEFLDRETSVNAAPALSRMSVGVVLERRKAASPWTDFSWRPVAVLPGRPQAEPWTVLAIDGEAATFYAGAVDLMLHRTETGQYRDNLASGAPSLWVALRTTGGEPPLRAVAVTADPAEGESFTQAGDDLVGAVPMPAAVCEMVEAFVVEHHVERPFFKRERERADPESLAHRRPTEKGKGR